MASPSIAANAYASAARMMEASGITKPTDTAGPSFGDLLKDAIGSVIDGGRQSDQQTVSMAAGKANVMDVVTAVAETDVKISTLVSVRDKVIAAYEDIMKMAI
jgi:flagellar hook-basal body complex protein FliE